MLEVLTTLFRPSPANAVECTDRQRTQRVLATFAICGVSAASA
jgi:hypothetical protein